MAGSIVIDRFHITGIAPGGHPDPGRLRSALDRIDRRKLVQGIGSAIGELGADDRRFIVLKRLDLATTESAIDDADALARKLGDGVRVALGRLSSIGAGETVVAFPSRAARIGAFAVAVSRGDAWGKWWFSDLDHLKVLPTSAAIRAALARDPVVGLEALGGLSDADRAKVIGSLSNTDVGDLLDDLEAALDEAGFEECWLEVFALPQPAGEWTAEKMMLHDLARIAKHALPSRAEFAAIRVRAQIVHARDPLACSDAIRTGSVKMLAAAAPRLRPALLAAVASLKASTRKAIAAELQRALKQPVAASFTRFGGVLLLWPHLPSPGTELPSAGRSCAVGLLGLTAIASLFGTNAAEVLDDPLLRDIAGIDPRATLDDMAEWLSRVPLRLFPSSKRDLQDCTLPAAFARFPKHNRLAKELGLSALDDFARRLPGLASASLPFLRTNLLQVGARVLASEDGVHAMLDRPPLDVLLSITGLADRTVSLADGRLLILERAA